MPQFLKHKRIILHFGLLFCILIFAFCISNTVWAAQMFFDAQVTRAQIGESFEVKLFINSENESINAFEGEMVFPGDILDLKEIRDGNSIVNFWIERPKEKDGAVAFSGITPGGFQGIGGLLFSVVFGTKSEGIALFEIKDGRVLRNDGTGSQAFLKIAPFEIRISSVAPVVPEAVMEIKDTEPPESFRPEIARDETLFEGKWFVVFATQDKSSGIDHYEIKESRQKVFGVFTKWIRAESPYILRDQALRSSIWIKAVDKAGNMRTEKNLPRNPLRWYKNYENWIIIIVAVFIVAVILGLARSKIKHQKSK